MLSKVELFQVGEIIAGDGYTVDEHKQMCAEISYIVSGNCDFYVDGKVVHAVQGDIHVIPEAVKHKIVVRENDKLRMVYMGFRFQNDELPRLAEFYTNPPLELKNDKFFCKTLFEELLNEIYAAQEYFEVAVDSCITKILINVWRIFQYESVAENERIVEEARMERIVGHAITKVLRYIDNHIESIDSIGELAKKLKYNPSYLSRVFHEKTGLTLWCYIEEKKVEKGIVLLKGGMSVSKTAKCLGYASSQSFCKVFTRKKGCSPTLYLEQERKGREGYH